MRRGRAASSTKASCTGRINCEDLHPALAAYADRIPHATVRLPGLKIIAKASFGFGDVNACVIFRKFENE